MSRGRPWEGFSRLYSVVGCDSPRANMLVVFAAGVYSASALPPLSTQPALFTGPVLTTHFLVAGFANRPARLKSPRCVPRDIVAAGSTRTRSPTNSLIQADNDRAVVKNQRERAGKRDPRLKARHRIGRQGLYRDSLGTRLCNARASCDGRKDLRLTHASTCRVPSDRVRHQGVRCVIDYTDVSDYTVADGTIMRVELLEKALEKLATSDRITIVIER
jgi:hypothetical protein